jgi:hypothetical protein
MPQWRLFCGGYCNQGLATESWMSTGADAVHLEGDR